MNHARATLLVALACTRAVGAQDEPVLAPSTAVIPVRFPHREALYWTIETIPAPKTVVPEITGILPLGDDRVMVCTRRGDVFTIAGASTATPTWTLFTDGLQEPLGLAMKSSDRFPWIYVAQRGELSRMLDGNNDGRVDRSETLCDSWQISGNYHEYCFGPIFDGDGNAIITLNIPFGARPFGVMPWRGWAMRVSPDGTMTPFAGGLRSPSSIGRSPAGDIFYADNQGEWCPMNKLSPLTEGGWYGHPFGSLDAFDAKSRVAYPVPTVDGAPDTLGASRPVRPDGSPLDYPDGKRIMAAKEQMPTLVLPAVWFPYDKMGRSAAGFVWDTTHGKFGPFDGQIIIADQYAACLMRADLEQIDGVWQGACFPFRSGLACGAIRVAWDRDHSLLVGETSRGWASLGIATEGLQRVRWTGETPFEILHMRAQHDGFEIEFTTPVDAASAQNPQSWRMSSFTYLLHAPYGSPEVDTQSLSVQPATLSADRRHIFLHVDGLRECFVHELHAEGVRSVDGDSLLHADAYYTLNKRPAK
ncbi:MAG: hypothetical protein EXS01_00465 [Phycisphaerales bacterium]|nr:hypothetical protein [Phycisphaerales bacterium]